MDIPDSLEKKAGPFPIWVWGAGIGLVAVFIMWSHNNSANSDVDTVVDTGGGALSTDDAMDANDAALYTGDNSTSGYSSAGLDYGVPEDAYPVVDNTSDDAVTDSIVPAEKKGGKGNWQRKAFASLVAQGFDPITAQRSLSRYLAGKPLSKRQQHAIGAALKTQGLPPDGGPAIKNKPRNVSTPVAGTRQNKAGQAHGVRATGGGTGTVPHQSGQAQGQRRTVTVDRDMSIAGLARKYLGSASAANQQRIRKANGVGVNHTFKQGRQVTIPR